MGVTIPLASKSKSLDGLHDGLAVLKLENGLRYVVAKLAKLELSDSSTWSY